MISPYDPHVARRRVDRVLADRYLLADDDEPSRARRPEQLIVEEPLQIRVDDQLLATTMRTPGHDFELAAGWCVTEGLVDPARAQSVAGIRYCATGSATETGFNTVSVTTTSGRTPHSARLQTISSSCGVCGVDSIESLVERLVPLPATDVDAIGLATAARSVEPFQKLFAATGGSHAAAAIADGVVVEVREDIGRHNAADKVIGRLLLDGRLPATSWVLWISGRASFEMVQKAWSAGFAALVSVSAPSALAVSTAERAGLVLAGFARDDRVTIYASRDRVGREETARRTDPG